MKIGVTGNRNMMAYPQLTAFRTAVLLASAAQARLGTPLQVHHGCCVGVDAAAHALLLNLKQDEGLRIDIYGHPSDMKMTTAKLTGFYKYYEPLPPLTRNANIVQGSVILLAFPLMKESEQPRSGTWATVRIARTNGIPCLIVYPDGNMAVQGVI